MKAERWKTRSHFLGLLGAAGIAGCLPLPAFAAMDVAHDPPVAGLQPPDDVVYRVWEQNGFRGYTIPVDGDVEYPTTLNITDVRAMPQRTQIAALSCVKGWRASATWRGVDLAAIIARVRPMARSRFVVFHCFDRDPAGRPFYESLDLQHAADRQTLLALEFNDRPIDRDHGGPVRLLVPRQPAYKSAKWIRRIELVSSLEHIGSGKGGYWEDHRAGY